MSTPENELGVVQFFLGVAAKLCVRVPEGHLIERNAELRTGIPSQMLVREKEHLVELFQVDIEQRNRIRRRADDAFVASAERFDRGGRVHVGDRRYLAVQHAYL